MLKKLKQRRLRVDILTIFITIFLSAVVLIIYHSHTRSTDAILKVGNDLIEQNHKATIVKLDNFFRPIPYVKIASYLMRDGKIDKREMESLSSFMHLILQSYPQLANAFLADVSGNFFIENKYNPQSKEQAPIPFINLDAIPKDTAFISEFVTHENGLAELTVTFKDKQGALLKKENNLTLQFDPRTRPWYQGALKMRDKLWIGIYKFFGTNHHGVSLSFPIYDQTKLLGVAGADISVNSIANALQDSPADGWVFIINNKGVMIAQRSKDQLFKDDFIKLSDLKNPILTQAYDLHQKLKKNIFTFRFNHKHYTAHFTNYAANPDEQWEIASVIPVDTFVLPIKIANQTNLFFSLVMFVLGLFLVAFFAHRIARPIMRLADETYKITELDFDKKIKVKSNIFEVQIMADALSTAKSALSSFAKYVPKTLVKQLIDTKMIAQPGGKKEIITIMFTDIENFINAYP